MRSQLNQRADGFTLTLLGVFVAREFAPVTYDDHTDGLITDHEYQVTERCSCRPPKSVSDASTIDAVEQVRRPTA